MSELSEYLFFICISWLYYLKLKWLLFLERVLDEGISFYTLNIPFQGKEYLQYAAVLFGVRLLLVPRV
jgi:hypothetical protein